MLQALIRRVRRWVIRQVKSRRILLAEDRLGGVRARVSQRHHRRYLIRKQKRAVIEDLYRSWRIGEIKPALKQDLEAIETHHESLPWTRLLDIQKRYWHENI